MKKHSILLTIKFIIFLILTSIIIISYYSYIPAGSSVTIFKNFILSYGNYAWLVSLLFVIIFASIGLPIIVPIILISLLFNLVTTFLLVCLGIYIGSIFSFFISRWLGKEYLENKFINKTKYLKYLDENLYRHGFYIVLLSRLIFLIPLEFTNIVAGVSKIKFKDYILATIIGIIPGTILMIYLIKKSSSLYSPQFIFGFIIYLLITLIPLLSKRIRRLLF